MSGCTCPECAHRDARHDATMAALRPPPLAGRALSALRIGGPLAIRCDTCRQPAGADCVLLSGPDGRPVPWPRRRPHACRVKAAPPEVEAKAGDIVILVDRLERLAVVASVSPLLVRTWNPGAGRFSPPHETALPMRLAPEDERTAARARRPHMSRR